MTKIKIRKFGDRVRSMQHIGEGSHVQQHLAQETDINRIMSKYQKTGLLTHVSRYAGQYGDFSMVPDYKTGLERIQASQEMFMSLPSSIRDRFNNDPAQFIEFATNPDNQEELQNMGLAPKPLPVVERPVLGTEGDGNPPKADKEPKGDQTS